VRVCLSIVPGCSLQNGGVLLCFILIQSPVSKKKVRIAAVFYAQKNKLLKFISAMAVSSKRAVCTTLHKTVMPTKVLVVLHN
jgi:hypothetical protein